MDALSFDGTSWLDIKISSEYSRYLYQKDIKDIGRVKYVVSTSYVHPRTVLYWPPWHPDTWNSICFIISQSETKVYSNGIKVAEGEGVLDEFSRNANFNLLGNSKEKERFLTFGATTDFNIWKRKLDVEEIVRWHNFVDVTYGKVLDWNQAKLELEGVEEVDIGQEILQKEDYILTSQKSVSYISRKFLSFEKGLYLCEDLSGHLAVPRDNINIGKWKNMVKKHEVMCNYRFFLGYIQSNQVLQFER